MVLSVFLGAGGRSESECLESEFLRLREGRQDRREIGGRWLWSVAADERRIGLKRCLGLWKASREELCQLRGLGLRNQHLLLKMLLSQSLLLKLLLLKVPLTRRRRRRALRGGGVVGAFDLRDRGQAASGGTGRTVAGAAAFAHGEVSPRVEESQRGICEVDFRGENARFRDFCGRTYLGGAEGRRRSGSFGCCTAL